MTQKLPYIYLFYTGPHTVCTLDRFRTSSVGIEIPGVQTKLADMDEEGNGEVGYTSVQICDRIHL